MIILDFDDPTDEHISDVIEHFKAMPFTSEIDLAASSHYDDATFTPKGFHLYVGLDKSYNVLPIYKSDIPGSCTGYNNCVLAKQEMVIRTSKKFQNTEKGIDTNIYWEKGYSRKDKDTWLSYGSEQLIAPLTTADGPSSSIIQGINRPRLKLRG